MSSPQQPVPPAPSSHTSEPATQIIRIQPLAYLACIVLFFGFLALATAMPAVFGWILIIPFLIGIWVARVRTVVGPDGIVARRAFTTTSVAWDDLDGLRFPPRGWARARLTDGTEVPLPTVTFGRLPQLAEASGGRITDPYAAAREAERTAAANTDDTPAETEAENEPK